MTHIKRDTHARAHTHTQKKERMNKWMRIPTYSPPLQNGRWPNGKKERGRREGGREGGRGGGGGGLGSWENRTKWKKWDIIPTWRWKQLFARVVWVIAVWVVWEWGQHDGVITSPSAGTSNLIPWIYPCTEILYPFLWDLAVILLESN